MAPMEHDGMEPDTTPTPPEAKLAEPPQKSLTHTSEPEVEDWVNNVDEVSQQIKDILNGTITDFDEFDHKLALKDRAKQIRMEEQRAKKERLLLYGFEGKGEGQNYKWWCQRCFVEYAVDLHDNKCTRCKQSDKMMTQEQRREDLMGKLDVFKGVKVKHQWRKDKWLRWKKSQALLKRSRVMNYKAWEYWEPDTDSEEEGDPIVPRENPEFLAMEADMKKRNKKQSEKAQTANKCRERGNQCMKEGDYIGAIENYEEGIEYRRDCKALWTNKALAEIKVFRWHDAIASANKVIEYSEIFEDGFTKSADACFKAFMRRAVALRALQKWDEALEDLQDALKLFPKDREARDLEGKTRAAVEEATQARSLHESGNAEKPQTAEDSKPETAPTAESQLRSDGSVRVEIEESDEEEEANIPSVQSGSLAGMSKPDFAKLMARLKANSKERTLFCSRRQGDSLAYANKTQAERDRTGRKVVVKIEEVPDASGLDNLMKDAERCAILWKKHQGADVEQIADPHDAAEAREALKFVKLAVPRVLQVLHLLTSSGELHCEQTAGAVRHVWPFMSSDAWRHQVLQILMEWSQCTVSGRAMAEFASRYPKPHVHLLIEAVTAEKKENILPPGFEDTAREAAARLERGDQDTDKAMEEILEGLMTMSATELAVSTLGNLCVAGQVLPAFKEQIAPFCQDIVAALARQLRPMDWRLCGRAAGAAANLLRCGDTFVSAVEEQCLKPLVTALKEESAGEGPMSMLSSLGAGDVSKHLPFTKATSRILSALVNYIVIRPSGIKRLLELGTLEIVVPLIRDSPDIQDTSEETSFRALTISSKLVQQASTMSLELEKDILRRIDKILEHECRAVGTPESSQQESALDTLDIALRILTAMVTKRDGVLDRLTAKAPRVQELPEGVDTLEDLAPAIPFGKLISRMMKLMSALTPNDHVLPDEESSPKSRIRGNLALLFAKLVDAKGDSDVPPVLKELNFELALELFVDWLRKERGSVQQNVGVVLTKLAQSPQYRQRARDLNVIESLHQIMLPRVEKQKAEASRLHRLRSERGLD